MYVCLVYANPELLVMRLIDEMQGIIRLVNACGMISSLCQPVYIRAS